MGWGVDNKERQRQRDRGRQWESRGEEKEKDGWEMREKVREEGRREKLKQRECKRDEVAGWSLYICAAEAHVPHTWHLAGHVMTS